MSYLRIVSSKDIPYEITDDAWEALPENIKDHYRLKTVYDEDFIREIPVSRDTTWNRPNHWIGVPDEDYPLE